MNSEPLQPIHVAAYLPPDVPPSFRVYFDNVVRGLPERSISLTMFGSAAEIPATADVLWDIRSGGGNPPPGFLTSGVRSPLVVTIHGFAPITLPSREYFATWRDRWHARGSPARKLQGWALVRDRIAAVVAVSNFTKGETVRLTGIPPERIAVCPHGVDTDAFQPGQSNTVNPYFLHVSNDEPRKNIPRIVRAFSRLESDAGIKLVLKVPKTAAAKYRGLDGVTVISEHISESALAGLYRGAMGFVFPSLYEGFGLPILESMSCGCPVITSSGSACAEVAGESALLVDPRDDEAISKALKTLAGSSTRRSELIAAGLHRVKDFSWDRSAALHADVFHRAAAAAR